LAEALQIAQQNSPVLKAAKSDVDGANAGAKAARAGTLPQLSVNGFATSGNNGSIVGSSPKVDPQVWMLAPTGGFVDGNLALMVPIFAPRLQAVAGSASWQARAAMGDLSEARADLVLQVTEAYDRVLLARQIVLSEQAAVIAGSELVRTTQALFDSGKGIEATVQRSFAELSGAQRALTTARNEEAKSLIDLAAAMNVDFAKPLDPSDAFVVGDRPLSLDAALAKAKASRGVLLAARARMQAASADIRAAEGQRRPQLYGSLMGDTTNRSDMGGLSAGLTLSYPLYDGGRVSAEVAEARSMNRKTAALLKQAEIGVEREIRRAWLDVESAHSNAISAEASVKAAEAAYEVTSLRVSAGKGIVLEQLDALEALVRAKSDLAQATFDQILAVARLSRAAGGQS
jgi:outer membrane protein TolC